MSEPKLLAMTPAEREAEAALDNMVDRIAKLFPALSRAEMRAGLVYTIDTMRERDHKRKRK